MPEKLSLSQALRQIEEIVRAFPDTCVLDREALSRYEGHDFFFGWEIQGFFEDSSLSLRLLADRRLPFQAPRVAVWPPPTILDWPHLEENGLLCLRSSVDSHSIIDIGSVTIGLLDDANRLVTSSLAGANKKEFEEEFQSYWGKWKKVELKFLSMCTPRGPSRWVVVWHAVSRSYVAEDTASLAGWLKNRFGSLPSPFKPVSTPLLWLTRPPIPKEFPARVSALRQLVAEIGDTTELLDDHLCNKESKQKSIIIGFSSQNGAGLAGFRTERPKHTDKGFRQQPPRKIYLERFGSAQLVGARVKRIDHAWIHGRDQNPMAYTLEHKTVLIFGVGSVGSGITEILAKSGVGRLILVDPEFMETENACRHALGVNDANSGKAEALTASLQKRYPHLRFDWCASTAEDYLEKKGLDSTLIADLIVSAIGSWPPEAFISTFSKKHPSFPPILFTWLEPHATAGHAVAICQGKGCLRCLTDDTGRPLLPVTTWEDIDTLRKVPSCGGLFQPYGAAESAYFHALAAEFVLDILTGSALAPSRRTWIGQRRALETLGGVWNPEWEARYGMAGNGGLILESVFEPIQNCPICGEK